MKSTSPDSKAIAVGPPPFVGDLDELRPGLLHEHFEGDVAGRAAAVVSAVEPAFLALRQLDEIFHALCRHARMQRQHERNGRPR